MSTPAARRLLVFGGSRGIGLATARLARDQGWHVVIHGRAERPELAAAAERIGADRVAGDVRDASAVEQAVRGAVGVLGGLDAVVVCSGAVHPASLDDMTPSGWHADLDVNLLGVANCCRAVERDLRRGVAPRLVTVSSIRGLAPTTSERAVAYSAAKAGVIALSTGLAKAWAPDVLVNTVCPGMTLTDMSATWSPRIWEQADTALVGRPARTEEIASVIHFLTSPASSYVTGQAWIVDGGYSIAGK